MSDFFNDLADSYCCLHKQDVPEVEAIIRVLLPLLETYWIDVVSDSSAGIVRELRELDDRLGLPEVDAIGRERHERRDDLTRDLVTALLASLRLRVAAPPPPALLAVLERASARLLARGAAGLREPLDLARAPLLRPGAAQELLALMRGRVELRQAEIEAHVRLFLTSPAARAPGPATAAFQSPLAVGGAGRPASFAAWLRELRAILGRDTSSWLPFTVDHWAYRWYSVGSFIAGRQNGVLAFRAQAVRDAKTTPFCRWVDGRLIDVGRAERQVERHVAFAIRGDVRGLIENWPLLDPKLVRSNDARAFARAFARVGLPPYHGRCRTIPVVARV